MVDGKYAVTGAQTPEVFHQIFDLVREDRVFTAAAE
jgi:predicted DsbA family dithiol-disulfide isomerase